MPTRRRTGLASAKRGLNRIEGLEEVTKNLSAAINSLTAAKAKAVFVEAAMVVRDEIRDRAPVETGALKKAIFAGGGDPSKPDALVGVNYGIAPHAHLVEFGHAGPHPAPPHPYFRPGLVAGAPKVASIITAGLKKIVESTGK